jgi:hypothetical protein
MESALMVPDEVSQDCVMFRSCGSSNPDDEWF